MEGGGAPCPPSNRSSIAHSHTASTEEMGGNGPCRRPAGRSLLYAAPIAISRCALMDSPLGWQQQDQCCPRPSGLPLTASGQMQV
ncbi:hypothetical protein NDU88_004867 [Pleurodeles waltl]|uniref:Uncharacterized protein n=1 Tax=Pleurodeles waltl TaxID=8319 RepID=A0AAV7RMP7_PLEWA|nr:hypothetical protein NDU88_004867 [Pleurodeles waltl]